MNILLIGNGFDLAHGLPTKYTDFLEWIVGEYEFYYDLKKQDDDIVLGVERIELDIPEEKKQKSSINNRIKCQVELWRCIDNNIWFEYFLHSQFRKSSTWIDFESEISEVIQSIDENMQGNLNGFVTQLDNWYLNKKFVDSQLDYGVDKIEYLKFGELRDRLLVDLNRLIRAFEIYLCDYVDKLEILQKSLDIEGLDIDYVISFNYTDTYSKLYCLSDNEDKERYDYIHGKAEISNWGYTNNMVLGIDEYLSDDRKNKDVEFIAFKKYYQRIYKKTGCKYKKWVDEIRRDYLQAMKNEADFTEMIKQAYNKEDTKKMQYWWMASICNNEKKNKIHHLYIFGHSLDSTDGDVLRDLILNDNVYTTIFYLNEEVLGQLIANLVKVIGQEELIRRTGGNTKTIEFRWQMDMKEFVKK